MDSLSMGKKKKNGYGKGTFVETSMILSKAFMSLGNKGTSPTVSSSSVNILMMLLAKRQYSMSKDHKGVKKLERVDDNKFTLTYKELENRGLSRGSITRGFDELLAKGFIEVVDPGGAFEKHKAVYSLEDTYLLWTSTSKQIFSQRAKDVHRGYQDKNRRGKPESTLVNDTHPHACQRGTPLREDTLVNEGSSIIEQFTG
jgi:hypothetical protein